MIKYIILFNSSNVKAYEILVFYIFEHMVSSIFPVEAKVS